MKKRIIALISAVLLILSLTACGGGKKEKGKDKTSSAAGSSSAASETSSQSGGGTAQKGSVTVQFMYGGDLGYAQLYKCLIDNFNSTAGKEKGITIKGVPKSGDLDSIVGTQLLTSNGADIVAISDKFFKKHCDVFVDLNDSVGADIFADIYPTLRDRYRYNIKTTTSNPTDPLYGLPGYNDATVLYYNKTALQEVGVKVISVDEKDLAAFNNGGKDANGKTKKDYGITVTVPAKGFYRSKRPFVPKAGDRTGSAWSMPANDEVLIFNDRIPMNWDEIEDLGMLCTKKKNSKSPTQYGFYTEWWFNYGFSVGGTCIEDLTGNGDWTFTLASQVPNYIVQNGKTYKGVYTGTTYKAGETLDFKDCLNANPNDKISYKTDGKTYYHFTVNGKDATNRNLSAQIQNGTLKQLPSIYDAFSRFCFLAGTGGVEICPFDAVMGSRSSSQYMAAGELALLVEQIHNYSTMKKSSKDEIGIAPLPQYKEYNNPSNPNDASVKVKGVQAGHSQGFAICVGKNSKLKDQAVEFVKWVVTDGQRVLANNGYISCRNSDAAICAQKLDLPNAPVVVDSIAHAREGDWWYMPDKQWISNWSTPLNSSVRQGKMKFEDFMYEFIEQTNKALAGYKK